MDTSETQLLRQQAPELGRPVPALESVKPAPQFKVVILEGWRLSSRLGPEPGTDSPRALRGAETGRQAEKQRSHGSGQGDPVTPPAPAAAALGLLGRSVWSHKQGVSGDRAGKAIFSLFQSLPGAPRLARSVGKQETPSFCLTACL